MSATAQREATLDECTEAIVERLLAERFERLRESAATIYEEGERVTEVFDTSQPTDSATGTPPLLSRTTEKRGRQTQSASREEERHTKNDTLRGQTHREAALQESEAAAIGQESRAQSDEKTKEEKRTVRYDTIICIGLLLLAGGVIILTIKQHFFAKAKQ